MKLDGRTKLITCIFLTLFMFSFHYYWQYGVIIGLFVIIVTTTFSAEQRQQLLQHWKLVTFLPSLNLFANLFFVNGPVLWSWGWLHLTNLDLQIFIRIALLLMFALALTIKTTPQELALSVGKIFHSVSLGRYNGAGVPLVIIIMVAFINEFQATFVTVQQAYKLRSSSSSNQRGWQRVKEYAFLLQPIILISMKKADQVADALIAKGYHHNSSLFDYQAIKYHVMDIMVYLVLILIFVGNWYLVKHF
ncbi:energy-coupling factor transporter transmembrane component T family protein [Bombilactobacillus bombi]|uniref:energy-coupling factor transporter transmembrane component T family protein n=1 Tax=Bombilactobacillus bombi TaxID=1303590 RepID=UPI0015E61DCD|nr:energy-coupling factor transporter transmembrane component T [Bombilactobacillus bombi]MBA1434305.1 energy-coupling factor transporter transmembrane protein EcfT [Bombilactobacillus bombi]